MATATRQPDLTAAKVVVKAGDPNYGPYVVLKPGGSSSPITVLVTVKNDGAATAPASTAEVGIATQKAKPGRWLIHKLTHVHRLRAGRSETVKVRFGKRLHLSLGLIRVGAIVNYGMKVKERRTGNDERAVMRIPVIAHEWDVAQMQTVQVETIIGDGYTEGTQSGFTFTFMGRTGPHGSFRYQAAGGIQESVQVNEPGICTGSGGGTAAESPWPANSVLKINSSLSQYSAVIDPSSAPTFTVYEICGIDNSPNSFQQTFLGLQTEGKSTQTVSMSPTAWELSGSVETGIVSNSTSRSWRFFANVG